MSDHNELIGEIDARVWVTHWLETISEHPNIPTDEGAMLAWFASAIMSGYDTGRQFEKMHLVPLSIPVPNV